MTCTFRSGRKRVIVALVCAVGAGACASASPPQRRTPQATPPESARTTQAVKGPQVPAHRIADASSLYSLCQSLRDADKLQLQGSEAEQEQTREVQHARRSEAMEARYVADLDASGFVFDRYDPEAGQLRLSDRRFALDEETIIDRPTADDPIGFAMEQALAERLQKLHADGDLTLRLVFQPQASQMRPDACLRRSGRGITLGAQVLAAYVLDQSAHVMARFETDQFAQAMAQLTPVQNPTVTVGKPLSADANPVPASWERVSAQLQAPLGVCYQESLARQNTIQGTLIVGITMPRNGRAPTARMEVSTITDDQLIACVLGAVGKASWGNPPSPGPMALSLPMTFGPMP